MYSCLSPKIQKAYSERLSFPNTLPFTHRTLPTRLSLCIMLWKATCPRPPPLSTTTIYPISKGWMIEPLPTINVFLFSFFIFLIKHIVSIDFLLSIYTSSHYIYRNMNPFMSIFEIQSIFFSIYVLSILIHAYFIFEKRINARQTAVLIWPLPHITGWRLSRFQ